MDPRTHVHHVRPRIHVVRGRDHRRSRARELVDGMSVESSPPSAPSAPVPLIDVPVPEPEPVVAPSKGIYIYKHGTPTIANTRSASLEHVQGRRRSIKGC
jgi:hypothetical protein